MVSKAWIEIKSIFYRSSNTYIISFTFSIFFCIVSSVFEYSIFLKIKAPEIDPQNEKTENQEKPEKPISYRLYHIDFMTCLNVGFSKEKRLTNNDINWKWKSQNYYSACGEGFNFFKGSDLIHNWTTTGEGFQLSTEFISLCPSWRLDTQNIY